MPSIPTGAFVWLYRIEGCVSAISLATRAEVSPLIGPLSLSGDVLTVLCLGEG